MRQLCLIMMMAACCQRLHAGGDSYISQMPTMAKVEAEVHGSDDLDTKAKQCAAYHILQDVITTVVSQTRSWAFTEKEKKYNTMYSGAAGQLILSVYDQLDPAKTERLKEGTPAYEWKKKEEAYENDPAFARQVVAKQVPAEIASVYLPLRLKREQEAEAYKNSAEYKQIQAAQQQNESDAAEADAAEKKKIRKWTLEASMPVLYIITFILLVVVIPVLVTRRRPYYYQMPVLRARKDYTVYTMSGTVVDADKISSTQVYSTGGSYNSATGTYSPASVHSSTTIHDQIFLIDDKGREHSVQLYNWDVAARTSNVMTVIWAVEDGKESGQYIAVLNHTTRKKYTNDVVLRSILRPALGWTYPILIVVLLLLPLVVLLASIKVRSLAILMNDALGMLYLWSWLFLLLGALVAATLLTRFMQREVRRFREEIRLEDFTPGS
ncbi:MAG: hypothetical protein JST83_19530 [Bacteroidetes bacterium]|nr:hypothetical protein [Bacteroidota bacterium]